MPSGRNRTEGGFTSMICSGQEDGNYRPPRHQHRPSHHTWQEAKQLWRRQGTASLLGNGLLCAHRRKEGSSLLEYRTSACCQQGASAPKGVLPTPTMGAGPGHPCSWRRRELPASLPPPQNRPRARRTGSLWQHIPLPAGAAPGSKCGAGFPSRPPPPPGI